MDGCSKGEDGDLLCDERVLHVYSRALGQFIDTHGQATRMSPDSEQRSCPICVAFHALFWNVPVSDS